MRKLKPVKKKLFFLKVPIYDREVCVVAGMTHEEAVTAATKQKCTKSFIKALEWDTAKEYCNSVALKDGGIEGAAARVDDLHYFIFVKPYKNNWDYFDMLSHECFHLAQFMGTRIGLWDDVEPPAYLHTWLFKNLRRTLAGIHD